MRLDLEFMKMPVENEYKFDKPQDKMTHHEKKKL
jgi:hypothetical protein